MTVSVFQMNDCDWWAAESEEAAVADYCEHYGLIDDEDIAEVVRDIRGLTDAEMDKFIWVEELWEPTSRRVTFRERLAEMVAAGDQFPCPFASTEY